MCSVQITLLIKLIVNKNQIFFFESEIYVFLCYFYVWFCYCLQRIKVLIPFGNPCDLLLSFPFLPLILRLLESLIISLAFLYVLKAYLTSESFFFILFFILSIFKFFMYYSMLYTYSYT